ncbi:hypothetical protein CDAR_18961 [Caerostris darwini]|uniref:Uncharacterized protein n=1 Tax=Caerostris darwini TaxID=1538125 RepID=A0AAV4WEF8_9ARAC|nr:hypothetical protein CDAR_18961 [Caerostris darwini]
MQIALIHVSEKRLPVELFGTSPLSTTIKRMNVTFLSQVTLSLRQHSVGSLFINKTLTRSDIHYHFPTRDVSEREKQRELLCFLLACFYISFCCTTHTQDNSPLVLQDKEAFANYCFPDQ